MSEVIISKKQEAIDFIYSSYLKAEKYIPYEEKDALRRSPDLLAGELNDEAFGGSTNVLVTGSKGKGSTARFIAALLSGLIATDHATENINYDNIHQVFQNKNIENSGVRCNNTVGLVTSPEVLDFCDRIQTVETVSDADGKTKTTFSRISDEDFVREISEIAPKIKEIGAALPKNKYVSPIGIVALAAQRYFSKENQKNDSDQLNEHLFCDEKPDNKAFKNSITYKVFECGKGAKYDDTNRIKHEVSVVTPIFLEHKRELGDTIEEIAEDKTCIVTDDVKACVSGKQEESVAEILEKRCREKQAEFYLYGRDFSAENIRIVGGKTVFNFESYAPVQIRLDGIEIPLLGDFQAENAATAIETVLAAQQLHLLNDLPFGVFFRADKMNSAFASVTYPGRLEVFRKSPLVVIDNTINRASAENIRQILIELLRQTQSKGDSINQPDEKYSLVLSIPNDKDFVGIAEVFKDIVDEIYLMPLKNPHYRIDAEAEKEILQTNFADASAKCNMINEDEISNFVHETKKPLLFCGVTAMVKEVHEVLQ